MYLEIQKATMILLAQIITASIVFFGSQASAQTNVTPFARTCATGIVRLPPTAERPFAICQIDIPAGKQLVVQAISAQLAVDIGIATLGLHFLETTNGALIDTDIFPMFLQDQDNETRMAFYIGAQALTLYVDPPADSVGCWTEVSRMPVRHSAFQCFVTGYLQ
jgi:hypothetical protein